MAVTYALRPPYVGTYGGGTIAYGTNGLSFNVGAALTAGGGSFVVTDADLAKSLDFYPPVYRASDDGQPLISYPATRWQSVSAGAGLGTSETAYEVRRSGEQYPRFQVLGDGTIQTGSGASAPATFGGGGGGGGGSPSGGAGGVLGGTYPNPSFAVDMATQAELNAVAATAATATEGVVNVRQYGALGAGATETTQLQAALNAAGGTVVVPGGTYLHGPLTVPSGKTVVCSPNAIFKPQTNASAILFDSPTARTPGTTYQTTVDTVVGAFTVTVSTTDSANFAAGDRVTLRDATYTLGGENVKREMNVVESVNTGTGVITLAHPVGHVYTAANDSWIAKVTPAHDIHWIGGQADCDAQAGGLSADVDFIEALYPENCTVEGLTVYNHPDKAVDFYCGLDSHIRDCNAYSPDLTGSGEGYNMRLQYSRDCTIEGGWSRNVRHHADISGGQSCHIKGGFSVGRTGTSQVGVFLHGLESRWCTIDGFVGVNLTDAAAVGNGTFGADYDWTVNYAAIGCDRGALFSQGSKGEVRSPYVRLPAAAQPGVEITGSATDVLVTDPDIDMGGIGQSAISASSLNASSRVFVKGGRVVMGNGSGTVTAILLNLPTGAAGAYGGVEGTIIEGTMVRGVGFAGASTEQSVRNVRFRGVSIGEAVRADAGEVRVTGCVFSGTVTTAVRAATSCTKVTVAGNDWGSATTRVSNTSSAVVWGTTKIDTEGTAAPTTGTWAVGDRCWNTAPGSILGWVCVTAGTPGTWSPFYTSTSASSGNLIVAATGASTNLKQMADYVCNGTADQTAINAALTDAAAAGDTGRVLLMGPLFTISGSILPKTYTALEAPHWRSTHIQAAATWTGGTGPTDRPAMIQNFDASTKFWRTRNIALLGNKSGGATVRGIAVLNTGGTITWSDPTTTFENTYIEGCSGVGFHHGDTARDTSVDRIRIVDCDGNGLLIDGQDSEFVRVQVGSCGGDGAADLTSAGAGIRFSANCGNNRLTSFKSWFSNGDGIWVGGVRNQLASGEAQDNNGNGINFTFDNNTCVGFHADSNNRAFSGTTGDAGVRIGASYITFIGNSYEKLEAGRTGSRQQYGVRITSACTDSVIHATCFQNTVDNFVGTLTGARNRIFIAGGGATTVDRPLVDANQLTTTSRLGGMQPTGTVATTIVDRTDVAGTFTPTSGTLRLAAGSDIGTYIPAGTVITNLNVLVNGTSGGVTLTNSWLCIVRVSTLAAQRTTVNRGTTALLTTGAPTVYPLATTLGGGTAGAWTCPVSDVYYIGFCVTGTTMPVLQGNTMGTQASIAPAVTGNSSTALTTPATLPGTVGALSGGGPAFWAWAT